MSSVEEHVQETCDACGCFAEIGTIIDAGDDAVTLAVEADSQEAAEAKVARYVELARSIYADVKVELAARTNDADHVIDCRLVFSCTAEKLIFEMRARAI